MNTDLQLWEFDRRRPVTFEEACQQRQALQLERPGPSPMFLHFARALQSDPIGRDPDWAAHCIEVARTLEQAVWSLPLPDGDLLRMLGAVITRANEAGLVVLAEALGMVFLPDGAVLPPEKRAQWRAMLGTSSGDYDARSRMTDAMQRRLAPHGIARVPAGPGMEAVFERAWTGGMQRVSLAIKRTYGIDHATVTCHHVDDAVEATAAAIFGADPVPRDTFWFHPGCFTDQPFGHVEVSADDQIRTEVDTLSTHGLPVLDLAREPGGLDRVMNDRDRFPFTYPGLNPRAPQNLADHTLNYGTKRCLRTLIVAHRAGNPRFDARVDELRRFAQGRADLSDADITTVVDHLRAGGAAGG